MAITFKPTPSGDEILHNGVVVGEINSGGFGFDPTGTGLVATNLQSAVAELTDPDNGGVKQALNSSGNAPIFACRAWVNFDGTTTPPTIRASGNVSSVAKNSGGDYTINFSVPLPDANYAVVPSGGATTTDTTVSVGTANTSSAFRVFNVNAGVIGDNSLICVAVFR